jgi:hypothetical protein
MKKKTRPKSSPSATPTAAIPPLAAAIARMADPMAGGVPRHFKRAYALMPSLIDKVVVHGDREHIWTVLSTISGLEAAHREADRQPRLARKPLVDSDQLDAMTVAVSVLNDRDPDLWPELTTPVMDGSFMTGVAFACYVLLNGGSR